MTNITEQDRRDAREWAEDVAETFKYDDEIPRETRAAVKYILATVDAPEPTLAEELRDTARWWREGAPTWEQCCDRFDSLADRAEQMETEWEEELDQISADRDHWIQAYGEAAQDLSEARAEMERERDLGVALAHERDDARAEVERLTAERQEETMHRMNERYTDLPVHDRDWTRTDGTPDPADVPEGQAWAVSIDDMEETAGFKASVFGWICYRELGGTTKAIPSDRITLVSRLVPAPRQITTRGELNALPEGTVIRAKGELVCERYRHRSKGLVWISTGVDEDFPVERPVLPATVLWAPEVAA